MTFLSLSSVISGVTILLSLTVFSQVVAETMPATSDAMPLLGNPKIQSAPPPSMSVFSRIMHIKSVFQKRKFLKCLGLRTTYCAYINDFAMIVNWKYFINTYTTAK